LPSIHKITAEAGKRTPGQWRRAHPAGCPHAGRIQRRAYAGAILLPNETITETEQPDILPDLNAEILIYCRSGNRSAQAANKLVAQGYTNVYDFGGIIDWPYETVTERTNLRTDIRNKKTNLWGSFFFSVADFCIILIFMAGLQSKPANSRHDKFGVI
jgi:rhodanese-related sulfurtransferase